jgi:hypothetical protein
MLDMANCHKHIVHGFPLTSPAFNWRHLITIDANVYRYQYTILKLPSTYYLLGYLTILCFILEAIIYFTGSAESGKPVDVTSTSAMMLTLCTVVDISISIFSRVNMLLSFVLASYVGICISRWDNIRTNMLGRMWGK